MTHLANLIHQEEMILGDIGRLEGQIKELRVGLAEKRTQITERIKSGDSIPDRIELITRQSCGGQKMEGVYNALTEMNAALLPFAGQLIVFTGGSRSSSPIRRSAFEIMQPPVSFDGKSWITVLGEPHEGLMISWDDQKLAPCIRSVGKIVHFRHQAVELEKGVQYLSERMILDEKVMNFPSCASLGNGFDFVTVIAGNEAVFDWWGQHIFGVYPSPILYGRVCTLLGLTEAKKVPYFHGAFIAWKDWREAALADIRRQVHGSPIAKVKELFAEYLRQAEYFGFDTKFIRDEAQKTSGALIPETE